MTCEAALTHTLVVMKQPAGFAVKAFVVLRTGALLTWVVARYTGWKTRKEGRKVNLWWNRTKYVQRAQTLVGILRHLHKPLRCCWSFSLWSSPQRSSGTDGLNIQDHRRTLRHPVESPPPRSDPDPRTHLRGQMGTLKRICDQSVLR